MVTRTFGFTDLKNKFGTVYPTVKELMIYLPFNQSFVVVAVQSEQIHSDYSRNKQKVLGLMSQDSRDAQKKLGEDTPEGSMLSPKINTGCSFSLVSCMYTTPLLSAFPNSKEQKSLCCKFETYLGVYRQRLLPRLIMSFYVCFQAYRFPIINSGDRIALRSAYPSGSYSKYWLYCHTSYCQFTTCSGTVMTSRYWSSCSRHMKFKIYAMGKMNGQPINSGDTVSIVSTGYGSGQYRIRCSTSTSQRCRFAS